MHTKPVSQKMGLVQNTRAFLFNAPEDAITALDLAELDLATRMQGIFHYIHLFLVTQEAMNKKFPSAKAHLHSDGMLWVSWPKAGKLHTVLTIKSVIRLGYDHGLVESKALSINETWSALKFTYPKPGKAYQNSYGTLK